MELKEIIKNLRHYNNWRRDNDSKYLMPEPKQVGLTIDAAISKLNKLLIYDVSHRTWNKDEVINQLNEFESIDEAKSMSNTSHIKFTMMYRETSESTFVGRVMEFPEIFIESSNLAELKEDLKGAINHVILKNKQYSSRYQGMVEEDLELCA